MHYPLLGELKKAYKGEAIFRPSSIDRVINCPGSVVLIARSKAISFHRTSRWTLEGSAMHALAEKALKDAPDIPDRWIDFVYSQDNQTVRMSQQMADGVAEYVNTVFEYQRPGVIQYVEQKLSLAKLNLADPLLAENSGTTDCIQLDYDEREIRIFDLKGGQGVMVSPQSRQLKNYALMALVSYPAPREGWKQVRLHVSQPRAELEEERHKWAPSFKVSDLTDDFVGELVGAMRASMDENAPLNPGSHCRWCPARSTMTCPALQDSAFRFAENPFDKPSSKHNASSILGPLPSYVFRGTEEQPTPAVTDNRTVVLRPLTELSNDDLATLYERAPLFEQYIAAARHLGVMRMQHGQTIPGWKIGYRTGHRKWVVGTDELRETLIQEGLKQEEIYTKPKIQSVHQIELALKKLQKIVPKGLYDRPQGAVVLMPSDSEKQAVPTLLGPIEPDENDSD